MMLPTVIILVSSGLVMGMLPRIRSFATRSRASGIFTGHHLGVWLLPACDIDRLAIGTLIGAGGHLLLQLPALFRLPERSYSWPQVSG